MGENESTKKKEEWKSDCRNMGLYTVEKMKNEAALKMLLMLERILFYSFLNYSTAFSSKGTEYRRQTLTKIHASLSSPYIRISAINSCNIVFKPSGNDCLT